MPSVTHNNSLLSSSRELWQEPPWKGSQAYLKSELRIELNRKRSKSKYIFF